ncbi:hypothetical protein DSM106972_094740 [Dulcicalothrix desertica PCC 7102]|uniref:Uncharacterized protein n=1 Tax=Dulcicalothrix desertica PCC 7102 TaxID=232991 RepID=A0A3S1BZ22_9CYAN|nr:hypothetical protein [Dulcicalothrix desertica]RUS94003.1 hypothetical protein DSM106972_094740 [Dulcicalothrix desertica PCC 7102]TWH62684.1 hypothetical protein CAL7102_00191 [Dulcicalothrix desertica PCC 7102]
MDTRKILIATKTYPSISKKYRETVCTAGVLLSDDEKPLQWIRIYPIPFRYIDFDQRYPRWSIIEADIERNDKDFREESYRINPNTINIVRKIGTSNNWQERKSLLLPLKFDSIKQIKEQNKSLGIIKPSSINKYYCKPTKREWAPKQQAVLDQQDLFEESVDLEKIPYKFGYEFTSVAGEKHKYSISDWEIMQLYRNCRNNSKANSMEEKEQESLVKVKQKLEELAKNNDLHFIVGNLKNHKNSFMIIGLFYPPIVQSEQLSLF